MRALQQYPGGGQIVCTTLDLALTNKTVREVVARDGDAATVGPDDQGPLFDNREDVGTDRATVRAAQVDAAGFLVGNDIGAEGDAVAVSVEDDGRPLALLIMLPATTEP